MDYVIDNLHTDKWFVFEGHPQFKYGWKVKTCDTLQEAQALVTQLGGFKDE